jgi:hypothetical protein
MSGRALIPRRAPALHPPRRALDEDSARDMDARMSAGRFGLCLIDHAITRHMKFAERIGEGDGLRYSVRDSNGIAGNSHDRQLPPRTSSLGAGQSCTKEFVLVSTLPTAECPRATIGLLSGQKWLDTSPDRNSDTSSIPMIVVTMEGRSSRGDTKALTPSIGRILRFPSTKLSHGREDIRAVGAEALRRSRSFHRREGKVSLVRSNLPGTYSPGSGCWR